MRRIPIISTLVVALAIAAMVGLGVWQLDRRTQKEAALARFATNASQPPIAFPATDTGEEALFRRSSLVCSRVVGWQREGGHDAAGEPGWRQVAECATGSEGPGAYVQIGVARAPDARPAWSGGAVSGWIGHAPDHRPLIAGLWDRSPKRLMLIADRPGAGLAANAPPDLSSVPNNHLAYAVQWFFFAAIAAVIYVLALRQRGRASAAPREPR